MKILVVEDEAALREGLIDLLEGAGHEVTAASDGPSAVAAGRDPKIDVVILDLMLPGMDGWEVCRRLRGIHPQLYVLMLTALGSEDDKVRGFGEGADDYVVKPFGARELLARVEAVERRILARRPRTIEVEGWSLDLDRCEARRGDTAVALTAREAGIIRWLHENRPRPVTRSELLQRVWEAPGDLETRTVDMTISNLRQKIESDPARPVIVVTVKGVGYAWGPE